ncbi:MAG: CGNR zinc finger domain-containing protein [Bryobacteraceae bacterium]
MARRIRSSVGPGTPPSTIPGGHSAVNFGNAFGADGGEREEIISWADLVDFLSAAGMVSRERAAGLIELPQAAPDATEDLIGVAMSLHKAVRRILEARVDGRAIEEEWVKPINSVLACTEGYDRLEPTPGTSSDWRMRLAARSQGLEWLLAAVARSAAELVAEGPGAPIRKCASGKCWLFFYDDSRTGRRRWCSMETCGNRAKVAAHARRKMARRGEANFK